MSIYFYKLIYLTKLILSFPVKSKFIILEFLLPFVKKQVLKMSKKSKILEKNLLKGKNYKLFNYSVYGNFI